MTQNQREETRRARPTGRLDSEGQAPAQPWCPARRRHLHWQSDVAESGGFDCSLQLGDAKVLLSVRLNMHTMAQQLAHHLWARLLRVVVRPGDRDPACGSAGRPSPVTVSVRVTGAVSGTTSPASG